jgi:predicted component of type VI protein secretion system
MLLENYSVFAKLQADLHTGLLSRLVKLIWVRQAELAILKALATAEDAATTHARRLFAHGDSVYQSLRLMESIALDISSLLSTEIASVKREKEEVVSKLSTAFGMHRSALRILEGRLSDLQGINDLWREAKDLLSLGTHTFNGIRSDLAALCEHQAGPKTVRLYVPVDQQNRHFQGWVRRLEARRVLTRAKVY